MRSLRGRLIAVWLLLLAAAAAIAVVFVAFYHQTIDVQQARAEDTIAAACGRIGGRYAALISGRPEAAEGVAAVSYTHLEPTRH